MRISLVSYTYNDSRYLEELLAHLPGWDVAFDEIVVIDDGSREPLTLPDRPRLRIVRNPVNLGPAAAKRQGLGLAGGDVLVSVDCDIRPHRKWLRHALSLLTDPSVGLVGAEHILATRSSSLASRWAHLSSAARRTDRDQCNPCINGGIFLLRRALYQSVGGIDCQSGAVAEDVRLSAAIAGQGLRVVGVGRYPVYQTRHLTVAQLCRQHVVYMGQSHCGRSAVWGDRDYARGQMLALAAQLRLIDARTSPLLAVVPVCIGLAAMAHVRDFCRGTDRESACLDAVLGRLSGRMAASEPLLGLMRRVAASLGQDWAGPAAPVAVFPDDAETRAALDDILAAIDLAVAAIGQHGLDLHEVEEFHYLDDKPLSFGQVTLSDEPSSP